MARIYGNVGELVGNTPLMELGNLARKEGLKARILAKLEYLNPAGSVKDNTRSSVGKAMIEAAEKEGKLKEGGVIIEPTLRQHGHRPGGGWRASKGYQVILTMPETMSKERRNILKAYGAKIVLTPGDEGMAGFHQKKRRSWRRRFQTASLRWQFENPVNPSGSLSNHRAGDLAGYGGRGGRICSHRRHRGHHYRGRGRYLKEQNPRIQVVAVEPAGSPVLSEGKERVLTASRGIGAGFVPKVLDTGVYDQIITATEEESYAAAKELAKAEGIQVGISSGAALEAAMKLARVGGIRGQKPLWYCFRTAGDRYYFHGAV